MPETDNSQEMHEKNTGTYTQRQQQAFPDGHVPRSHCACVPDSGRFGLTLQGLDGSVPGFAAWRPKRFGWGAAVLGLCVTHRVRWLGWRGLVRRP